MNIEKFKENFKDRKSRYFNCNIYGHLAKDYKRPKKERDIRKCYKYKKVEYITKDCRTEQKIKNWSIQEDIDMENNNKKQGFGDGF